MLTLSPSNAEIVHEDQQSVTFRTKLKLFKYQLLEFRGEVLRVELIKPEQNGFEVVASGQTQLACPKCGKLVDSIFEHAATCFLAGGRTRENPS